MATYQLDDVKFSAPVSLNIGEQRTKSGPQEHLVFLHATLQQLTSQLTQELTEGGRAELESRINFVTQTLERYRSAYQMERSIREGRTQENPHLLGAPT